MHGHTRLELIWTAIPVVILAIIAGFVFYQLPDDHLGARRRGPDPRHGRGSSVLLAVRLPEPRRARSGPCMCRSAPSSTSRSRRGRDPQLVDPGARRQDPGDPGPTTTPGSRRRSRATSKASAPSSAARSTPRCSPRSTRGRGGTTSTTSRPGRTRSASRSGTASARPATGTSGRAATARTSEQSGS